MCAIIGFTASMPEVNRLAQVDHLGRVVYMDVIHDAEEKTVLTIIGDVSHYDDGVQTVNFHDYNTGYGVLKDINNRICILTKSPVPMASSEKYRMGFTTEVHAHLLKNFKVLPSVQDVDKIAGGKIAEFCKDYITVSAKVVPVKDTKREAEGISTAKESKTNWCVFSSCRSSPSELRAALQEAGF